MSIKLGNIVTDAKDWFGKEFNVIKNEKHIIPEIPTLYIGYYDFKSTHPNVNILDFKYDNNTYWTFRKLEDRTEYINGINKFNDIVYNRFKPKLKYKYINPITTTISEVKEYINIILTKKVFYYIDNERMIFFYYCGVTYGIDLMVLKFLNISTDKILNKINSIKHCTLLGSNILIEYKDYIQNLNDEVKWLPYLYSIDNEKTKNLTSNIR